MERCQIISALSNCEKESDIIPYLYLVLDQLSLPKNSLTIQTNSPDFSFITKLYPNVTLKIVDKPDENSLYFKKVEKKEPSSLITYTFSFYGKSIADFNFNLQQDGVFIDPLKPFSNPYQFNPYYICLSDKLDRIQLFLDHIKETSDVFIPLSSYHLLPYLDFKKISKRFDTVEIYNKDNPITSISSRYSENPKTLRIKPLVDETFSEFFIHCNEIMIDTCLQMVINMLYYTSIKIWSTLSYKYVKPIPLATEKIKERMDRIIKLGSLLPQLKDVIEIILYKKDKLHKLRKLT
jgi:hypothetical protein